MGDNILLSPNPSNGSFNLSNPDGKEIELVVYNSLGQLVYQKQSSKELNATININDQAAGIYFVKLRSNGEEVIKKVVVEK
jgi:hypothetical protein